MNKRHSGESAVRPHLTVANVGHLRQLLAKAVEYANARTVEYQGVEMFEVADFDPLFELVYEVARLRAGLKAEIDRNTPLEARMRKALEEIRSFVCVPVEASSDPAIDDMASVLNAGSVIRMSQIAREALRITESPTEHKGKSPQ